MLNTLRKGAATWVAKIFIGLLVLSFAVWGIADIFSGYGQRVLASVGEIEISPQEYERQLQQQIKRLSIQFRQQISAEQARAFGLDRQVLNSLITNAAVDQQAAELHLGVSDQSIRDEIFKNPVFQGDDGKFDRNQFVTLLRNNGTNENRFVHEQRVGAIRSQLVNTITGGVIVPRQMLDILNSYDNNKRVLDYFIVPKSAVKAVKAPDEATQKSFLESNKRQFTAPEYRKVGLLKLNMKQVRKTIKVSDEDVRNDYQSRLDQFTIPGKRHILRMSFIDRDTALKAKKDLDGGADFMTVAKKYGFDKDGADLGMVDKANLKDNALAELAFKLKQGEISEPTQGALSTMIVKVVKIDPNKVQKKFEDVKKDIHAYLITERAADKIGELQDRIEDDRAAGRSLQDIAQDTGLEYKVTAAISSKGEGPDGKRIKDFPSSTPRLLSGVFSSDVGVENDPVEGGGDGAVYWFEVLDITPERLKKLAEVKDDLIKQWKQSETEKRLGEKASYLVASLKEGKAMKKVAKPLKVEVKQTKPITRIEEHDEVPRAAVTHAFALAVGEYGMNSLPEGKGRIIFRVVKKNNAEKLSDAAAKQSSKRLKGRIENDLVSQYIAGLRKTYGVKINQKMLSRLNGVTQ